MTGWKNDLIAAMEHTTTRLRTRLVGLGDDEYLWEPAPDSWTIRPDEGGSWLGDWESPVWPPPLTTIAWRLGHIVQNLFDRRYATHLGLEPLRPPPASLPPTADEALALLDEGCVTALGYLGAMDESALGEPLGPVAGPWADDDRASFVLHILDELTHHGAEVAVLRDLYRSTRPPNPLVDMLLGGQTSAAHDLIGRDPNLLVRARSERADLLIQAAAQERHEAVPLLVELGFRLSLPDGSSALHHAAATGRSDTARLLRDAGADLELRDPIYRATPGEWAAFFGQTAVAEELR